MSEEVNVLFEVRDMAIMKDTLKELGHKFSEVDNGNVLSIQRDYHSIMINGSDGKISYDNMDGRIVNKIKQSYMVNYYKQRAIKEGMQYKVNKEANGDITIDVYHG